jgi:predicted flap endonuclease-1-like 5' DNA nuclease
MMDVIRDAWPWVLPAFLLGLVLGWLTTWLYYRGRVGASASSPGEFNGAELARASTIIGLKVRRDDLRLIEGIGPKIEKLMNADGINTWEGLATASQARLQKILDAAGNDYAMHDPGTWSRQARLLTEGKWAEFKRLTDELDGGR